MDSKGLFLRESKVWTAFLMTLVMSVVLVLPAAAEEINDTVFSEEVHEEASLSGFVELPYGEFLPITEENFPDANFRGYMIAVLQKYGAGVEALYGSNPMVSMNGVYYYAKSGIPAVTGLSPDNLNISSIKGIEYFTALTSLSVSHNNLTSLDFSENTALTGLNCAYNSLTSLDFSENTALTGLNCAYNSLTSLNISACKELAGLNVMSNKLTGLDISNNKKLAAFACTFNAIPLLDFRGNTVLNPFDQNSFSLAMQSCTLTVICDPGSRFEDYCNMYLIPYSYSVMKERPKVSVPGQNKVVMVKEKADLSSIFNSLSGGEKITGYEVSPKENAVINKKGIIRGKKEGEVTVTAYAGSGSSKRSIATYPITIEKPGFSEKKIKSTSLNEVIFASSMITGTEYAPDGFLSSNTKVAEAESVTGKITVKGRGSAKITALYGSGRDAAKVTFTLKAEIPSLNKTKIYLKTGESKTLKLRGTKEKPVFRSSDETVAIVGAESGQITALTKGTAKITAYLNGAGYECVVIVV